LQADPKGEVRFQAFSSDGKRLASINDKGTLQLWDLEAWKLLHTWQVPLAYTRVRYGNQPVKLIPRPGITSLVFSNNNQLILAPLEREALVYRWQASSGAELKPVKVHSGGPTIDLPQTEKPAGRNLPLLRPRASQATMQDAPVEVLVPLDEKTFIAGRSQPRGSISVVQAETGLELRRLDGKRGFVRQLAVSSDGRTLAVPLGNQVVLHEVVSGRERCRLQVSCRTISAIAFSPSGNALVAASDNQGPLGDEAIVMQLWGLPLGRELARYEGPISRISSLTFSPDGRFFASAGLEPAVLVWDVSRAVKPGQLDSELSAGELARLWSELAGTDAADAYQAIGKLAQASRQAIPFLSKQLEQAPIRPHDQIDALVADLDSDRFAAREQATKELAELGSLAEPALRGALTGNPSAELRSRAEELLKNITGPPRVWLQQVRALEVLELVGNPEAQKVLQSLASRGPETSLAQEARASLARLLKRSRVKPG
jgi:WD domain, G-beta repeat